MWLSAAKLSIFFVGISLHKIISNPKMVAILLESLQLTDFDSSTMPFNSVVIIELTIEHFGSSTILSHLESDLKSRIWYCLTL